MRIVIKHANVVPGQASVHVKLTGPGVAREHLVLLSSAQPWQSSLREWAAHVCKTDRDDLDIEFQPL